MTGIKKIDVSIPVTVRKYEVDVERLKKLLKTHKKTSGLSNKQIAEKTDKPITLVEHWFRSDKSFAIPDADIWEQLKTLLNIQTNDFDLSITEFEEKPGEYEQRNRIYLTDGIAPTITTGSELLILTEIKIAGDLQHYKNDQMNRVYNPSGIAPTALVVSGGGREIKILVGGDEMIPRDYKEPRCTLTNLEGEPVKCFAERGRYNAEGKTEQQIEFRKDDVTSTLTGVQKDNMLLEIGVEGMKTLKVNDLFCGAGGMGIGFKQAGFETAGAWDFDSHAVKAYAHNVDPVVKEADITEMNWDDMPKADVWTFGAPCQAFSVAGKQLGMTFKCPSCGNEEQFEGEMIIDRLTPCSSCGVQSEPKDIRGILFFEVMRLLKHTNANSPENMPPVILLENVKGISKFLDVVAYEYEKRGYKLYKTLYNTKFWGLPQNRERWFICGVHESIEKEFKFPIQQEDYIPRLSTILESEVDEKYYIDDLKAAKIIEQAKQGRRAKDNKESFRVRKLTPHEYLRLQGFPESFEIVCSDSQTYKQAGNAVSVPVARAIAERIRMFLLSL